MTFTEHGSLSHEASESISPITISGTLPSASNADAPPSAAIRGNYSGRVARIGSISTGEAPTRITAVEKRITSTVLLGIKLLCRILANNAMTSCVSHAVSPKQFAQIILVRPRKIPKSGNF